MKIEVEDIDSGTKSTYDLSKDNWRKHWACMLGGLVHMWVPSGLAICSGAAIRTSGRIWRVL